MPKLTTYVKTAPTFTNDTREVEWLKPADIAKDGQTFCINKITESKSPDDWGNLYWYLEITLENHPIDTIYMTKLGKTNGKRDDTMNMLRAEMLKAHEQNSPDCAIHQCMFVALPAQKKGMKPYMHLTSHAGACACGFLDGNGEEPYDSNATDHPF